MQHIWALAPPSGLPGPGNFYWHLSCLVGTAYDMSVLIRGREEVRRISIWWTNRGGMVKGNEGERSGEKGAIGIKERNKGVEGLTYERNDFSRASLSETGSFYFSGDRLN